MNVFVPIFFTKKLQIKTVSQEELKKHFDAKKLIVRPMSHTIFFFTYYCNIEIKRY